MEQKFINNIFTQPTIGIEHILPVFSFQYQHNSVYQQWCQYVRKNPSNVHQIQDIPFLPISFFKTSKVVSGNFTPEAIFESSGTTQTVNSKHFVKDLQLYEKSFLTTFQHFFGNIQDYCIIGLLPNYLEKGNSSLVKMVDTLIRLSRHPRSGFYLHNHAALAETLHIQESKQEKTLLLGVTFALLDFIEKYHFKLKYTLIMDTGGMKGRKKEMTKQEIQQLLKEKFGVKQIFSEYGMTELLSQAYAQDNGMFSAPSWMKVLVREENDPFALHTTGKGLLNIIDLANIYSCAFIATDDIAHIYPNHYFEILGRFDTADIRGCSLLTA